MNDYRITYTSQSGEESNAYVTERTEASARKFFNSTHKGMGFTIQNVELHRENTCATKQQDPQSYLATAFQGCFEDAEQNIENDFGDSMKGRAESAERKAESLESQVKELQEKLRQEIAERQRARDEAQEFIKKLEAMVLSPDDLEDLRQLASDRATEADELVGKAAAEIVKYADDPTTPEPPSIVGTCWAGWRLCRPPPTPRAARRQSDEGVHREGHVHHDADRRG